MKTLPSVLVGTIAFCVSAFTDSLHAATNYEGALEFWHNTSSNVVPFCLGARLRARPGAEPFLAPTLAWNGESMAFPGLNPAEPLTENGFFISNATYTNDPGGEEFLGAVFLPIAAEGLSGGATNVTPEPMPIYAELASPFAAPCPPAIPASIAGSGLKLRSAAGDDCLECANDNCTEALRERIEKLIKKFRRENLKDEAFLLEQMLAMGNFVVDATGQYTRHRECEISFGALVPGTKPTLYISPDFLCKTNAADMIALVAGIYAVFWENPVLRRNDEISAEAAVLITLVALTKKDFAEFKKILEALQKPLRAVEGPFPIMTCLFDALCKASTYKGARSDEAEAQARELKRVLKKIKDLNKDFENLSRAEQEAFIQNMIDKFKAIIVAIKARNWVQLEALGIPRYCIDPAMIKLADEFSFSTTSLPGKADTGKLDQNQTQDFIVPSEVENTVRIYPAEEDFQIGSAILVPVPGGPHVAVSLIGEDQWPNDGDIDFVAVGTRSNGVFIIRFTVPNLDPYTVMLTLSGPTEILALHGADVNGDGAMDLIALAGPSNAPAIVTYLRTPQSPSHFEMTPSLPYTPGGVSMAVGDWNGDGSVDLAVARPGFLDFLHTPAPLEQDGIPFSNPPQTVPGVAQPTDLQMLDIDGNHRPDLVLADAANSRVQVWLNDSPGGLRPGNSFSFPEPVTAVAVGDLDGNGIPDVLAALGESPRLGLQMNPGWDSPPADASTPPETLFIDLQSPASQLLLRDLDGDDDRDLVVGTAGGIQVFQRLFSTPIVECSLRLPAIRANANTVTIERTSVAPSVLAGPFKLLYRDDWQAEWRPVPASEIVSMTPNQWVVRRGSNSFQLYRVAADAP